MRVHCITYYAVGQMGLSFWLNLKETIRSDKLKNVAVGHSFQKEWIKGRWFSSLISDVKIKGSICKLKASDSQVLARFEFRIFENVGPEQQSGSPSVCLICSHVLFKASISLGFSATWSVNDKEVICVSIFFHDCICDTCSLSYFPGFCTAELYSKTSKQLKINHTEIQGTGFFRKSSDRRRTCRDSNMLKPGKIISQKSCPCKLSKSC